MIVLKVRIEEIWIVELLVVTLVGSWSINEKVVKMCSHKIRVMLLPLFLL